MRVILGGSFDPVHEGHVQTACELSRLLGGSTVHLMPAARSPLKPGATADAHRLAMLQRAIAAFPLLAIDDRELHRPPPSFTVETLRTIRQDIGPDTPLVWVVGSDTLATFDQWKDWQSLGQLAHLLVVMRPGFPLPVSGQVADWLASVPQAASPVELGQAACGLWAVAHLTPWPVSSTAIRTAIACHRRPAGLQDAVWQYIQSQGLYLAPNPVPPAH